MEIIPAKDEIWIMPIILVQLFQVEILRLSQVKVKLILSRNIIIQYMWNWS